MSQIEPSMAPGIPGMLNKPCGPPKNKVTMMPLMVMVFMNSAKKNSPNRILEYSVLNPPTSSCSASTKSNGGRFISAVAANMKMMNGMMPVDTTCQSVKLDWWPTMPLVDKVPAIKMTVAILSPRAASYETICAEARTDPSNGYFEPLDQPANMIPYTAIDDRASNNKTPIGGSASCTRVA